jgi:RNA polymerase sigma-70 factor (ECF subfamily)
LKTLVEQNSDEEILRLSLENPKYFEILVSKYKDPFIRKARSILKSDEDAEDTVQEAFVKIYIKANKFRKMEGASFNSWAYKILINTALTMLEKSKRHYSQRSDSDIDLIGGFDSEFEKITRLDEFLSYLSKLPLAFQRVLKMATLDGISLEKIAEKENVSVGAIRTKIHRAKKAFEKTRLNII